MSKVNILTGRTYPDPADDYSIFEAYVEEDMRRDFFSTLLRAIYGIVNFDNVNFTHDTGDNFIWANDFLVKHPYDGFNINIVDSIGFPGQRKVQMRDGSFLVISIPASMNSDLNIKIVEKSVLSKDAFTDLVLCQRIGNKVYLKNGQIVNV